MNSEQNNFTEDSLDQEVELTLSTGDKIKYRVGDKPFSASCDYMEKCEYACNTVIKTEDMEELEDMPVFDDTYSEPFIVMYLDKIHQRIREAFYHRYAYEKIDLINEINKMRTYPLSQINYALEQFINDKNLFLVDAVGRNGHLVNIGEYYMFQPEEINSKTISHEERRIPIDYKRENILVEVPKKIRDSIIFDKDGISDKDEKEDSKTRKDKVIIKEDIGAIDTIIKDIKEKFDKMTTPSKPPEGKDPLRGQKDWYAFCARTTHRLIEMGIDIDKIKEYAIGHLIDSLIMSDKKLLYNHIYSSSKLDTIEKMIKTYLDQQSIRNGEDVYILLLTDDITATLFKYNKKDKEFIKALPSEISEIQDKLVKLIVKANESNKLLVLLDYLRKVIPYLKQKILKVKEIVALAVIKQVNSKYLKQFH